METLTTVGFGDVMPTTSLAKLLSSDEEPQDFGLSRYFKP